VYSRQLFPSIVPLFADLRQHKVDGKVQAPTLILIEWDECAGAPGLASQRQVGADAELLSHCPKYVMLARVFWYNGDKMGQGCSVPADQGYTSDCHPIPVFLQCKAIRKLRIKRSYLGAPGGTAVADRDHLL
jgi:hypothetical protein